MEYWSRLLDAQSLSFATFVFKYFLSFGSTATFFFGSETVCLARCQAKFLTSGHLRMRWPIFQIRNFACISGVWMIENPDHLFRKRSVSVTAVTKAVY